MRPCGNIIPLGFWRKMMNYPLNRTTHMRASVWITLNPNYGCDSSG